jgi:hypothetical protein
MLYLNRFRIESRQASHPFRQAGRVLEPEPARAVAICAKYYSQKTYEYLQQSLENGIPSLLILVIYRSH